MSPRRPFACVVVAMSIATLSLAGSPGTAFGTPPPPNPSDGELAEGRTAVQTAAEQVGVLASRVAAAGAALDAAQLELAAKYDNVTVAQRQQKVTREVADAAQAAAEGARVEVEAVGAHIQQAQRQVDKFAAASYRQGSAVGSISAYLGAESPKDLLARADLLNAIGGAELDALDTMSRALVDKANLNSAARAAFAEARTRQQQAEEAEAAATAAYESAVAAEAAAQRRAVQLLSSSNLPTRGAISPAYKASATRSTIGRLLSRQRDKRLRNRHKMVRVPLPHPVRPQPGQRSDHPAGHWHRPRERSPQLTGHAGATSTTDST